MTAKKKKTVKRRGEIRVGIRSGSAPADAGPRSFRKIRIAIVGGGPTRPMLWLGAGERDGVAWVCGRDTLLRLRDALTAVLKGSPA
jgi:hypothetical protein